MALQSPRNAYGEPPICRAFTSGTARILHQEALQSGAAPPGINHLPCGIIIDTGTSFVFVDATGTTITLTVPATALGLWLPFAPAELTAAGTYTVKVFWHRGATKTP